MNIHPPSAEEKLGFDVVRGRLAEHLISPLGEDRLAAMRPARDPAALRAELDRVSELQQVLRFDDPLPLDAVLDVRAVLRSAAPEGAYVGATDLWDVHRVAATARRLKEYFERRRDKYPALGRRLRRLAPLPDFEAHVRAIIEPGGAVRDDASPELARLRRQIGRTQARLRETLMAALRSAIGEGYATEEQPTIRNGRMVIPVRAEAKRKVQGFVHDTSASGQTVYIEPAASLDLNNELRELEGEERREVERILRAATALLRQDLPDMQENVRTLAAFDLVQAKARLANELDAVVPQLVDEAVLDIRAGRNPVLLLHFRRQAEEADAAPRAVVPLDLTLGVGYRTLVITGPNAGGKTVAMKTAGLFALMLAYGLPLPLDPTSRLGLFTRLFVDIGDEQSIEEDLSTFSSHVANLKKMLAEADEGSLILIDEAGTGTDPAEGGALAQAVLERLTEAGARTIATTHHGTLKVFAHQTEGIENGSMAFDRATLSPTYRFRAGVPGSSYAFDIARRIGLGGDLLDRARALVGEQQTALEDLVATFDARSQALAEKLAEAERLLAEAEKEKAEYETRMARLKKDADHIRKQALEEAERVVRESNAQIERTIREIKEAQAEREATLKARAELEAFKERVGKRQQKVERRLEQRRRDRLRREAGEPAAPRRPAETAPPARAGGALGVGDQVVLDGGTTAAEILEIERDEALVALGSMKMRVDLGRLTKVGGPRKQQVTIRQTAGGDVPALRARPRIDLRGQRVDEALGAVERFLDEALAAGLPRAEILHGKGTGALREAVHDYLAASPHVASFADAPIDQGGAGVTIAQLA
ncbi:MAG: endonuclease MutS2 [Rhodothermales bacterium]|nr:endonuclease MutS2 [Rhodothermales bacterium]